MHSTSTRLIHLTAHPAGTPQTDRPRPDRLLRGNPLRQTWNLGGEREHIDADNYIKKLEAAIFNANIATLVESDEFRDKLRVERAQQQEFADPKTVKQWGMETGADLMLFGEMTSETDVYNKERVVNYITTLFLTDMETNQRVWYGQQEIKKHIRN